MADGDGPAVRAVPQIPAEYDDLYLPSKSLGTEADFSLDINSKMKVPTRLSVDGQYLHDLEVENKRTAEHNDASSNMAIPHRITLSGDDREDHNDPYRDPYNLGSTQQYVAITTPPRVIAADTHSFPSINEEEEKVVVETEVAAGPTARSVPVERKELSVPDLEVGTRRKPLTIESLERRILDLEERERSRQTRETRIIYPTIALYILYKLFSIWRSR